MKKTHGMLVVLLAFAGCSVTNAYMYPETAKRQHLITTGDIDDPYDSLGYIQITKTGMTLFGFLDILDADLQGMFQEVLLDEIEKAGADGIINLHFHETQYTTATRTVMAIFFFIPLPRSVEVTGELVKLKPS